jgi:hypothetical protein
MRPLFHCKGAFLPNSHYVNEKCKLSDPHKGEKMKKITLIVVFGILFFSLILSAGTNISAVSPSEGGTVYLPVIINIHEGPIPNAPSNLHTTSVTSDSLSVSWNDNSMIEDVFEVWYQEFGGVWFNPSVPANTTNYLVSDLNCATLYNLVVRAVRWEGGEVFYSESNYISVNTSSCGQVEELAPPN